ncbi:hypothetical protein Mesau_03331 [Mesorhizobium australicum WSM2073]|uniref:Uncharacterized protein n=1 Tax=Mesorhizobium australicum (strain HAMBI 3006 / LMG 24608 / WSM2073) TaxID=754035 RepID=L0KNV5_MESAW|nr:hypothetical protein Mesau_03331 [Mesorhizobium australicum WSM2073]
MFGTNALIVCNVLHEGAGLPYRLPKQEKPAPGPALLIFLSDR